MNNILLFTLAFLFAAVINFLFAQKKPQQIKETEQERWKSIPISIYGGVSMYLIFVAIILWSYWQSPIDFYFTKITGLLFAASFGFFLGLIDDIQNIPPWAKFLGQIISGAILLYFGYVIKITDVVIVNQLFTLLWIVGIMNSINMIDNMDGVATIIAIGALCCMIIVFSTENTNPYWQAISIAVIGSLFGFLSLNWPSAKIYMGDSGSQFLGVILAGLSIMSVWHFRDFDSSRYFQFKQFALPLIIFLPTIIDTVTVTIRRLLRGDSPFKGGRDHTTHQVALFSGSENSVAITFSVFTILCVALFYWLYSEHIAARWNGVYNWLSLAVFVIVFTIFQLLYTRNKKQQ